jgi:hypothetical protein
MKALISIIALILASQAYAYHSGGLVFRTVVPAEHTYIPKGYDSNDNVEIIVEGFLPNLCYKSPHSSVTIEGNKVNINLLAWSSDDGTVMCAEMVVPFIHTVSLGVLDKGNYEVVVNKQIKSQLFVDESSSDAIDDMIYANVEFIERVQGQNRVLLKGHNPSDCFVFDHYELGHNDKDVISVQPVMKQVSSFCPMKMVPFELELDVPQVLERDKVLLHVRSMNGKSVNQLYRQR